MLPPRSVNALRLPPDEIVDFSLGLVTRVAITFLNAADELLRVALSAIEIIIGELSPSGFNVAFQLVPLSLQDIFVHEYPPYSVTVLEQEMCPTLNELIGF
jgi:hypothetical protein